MENNLKYKMDDKLVTIMDLGSTAIRMLVAEINENGRWKTLETAAKNISLGRDSFSSQSISAETINQAVQIIKGYQEILKGWKIKNEDVIAIGTSALREASNRDTILDRILVHTGIRVEIIDGVEENRLTYAAVEFAMKNERKNLARSNSLIIEVGGGSTELMLLQRNRVIAAHSLKLGTIRLIEQMRESMGSNTYLYRYINENIQTTKERLDTELELKKVRYFIAVGGDVRIAAERIGQKTGPYFYCLKRKDFLDFMEEIRKSSVDEIVSRFHIPYQTSELLSSGLEIYRRFLEGTSAEEVYVPTLSIREGTILTRILKVNQQGEEPFREQMCASATALGKKYMIDEDHAANVVAMSKKIFSFLKKDFKIPAAWASTLEITAILHDIGTFINAAGHHKHGQYIVEHSEIFGLGADDLKIIGHIIRYHRKKVPGSSNPGFHTLSRETRIKVLKLAAILRVADALDRGHSGKFNKLSLKMEDDCLIIQSGFNGDLSIERSSLREKADLFNEVFGLEIRLN